MQAGPSALANLDETQASDEDYRQESEQPSSSSTSASEEANDDEGGDLGAGGRQEEAAPAAQAELEDYELVERESHAIRRLLCQSAHITLFVLPCFAHGQADLPHVQHLHEALTALLEVAKTEHDL